MPENTIPCQPKKRGEEKTPPESREKRTDTGGSRNSRDIIKNGEASARRGDPRKKLL